MKFNIKNTNLYKQVIDEKNIFSALYSLESYIFEFNLLESSDQDLYYKLKDPYDINTIEFFIKECQTLLEEIITSEKLFDISVYFKAKKYIKQTTDSKDKTERIECRPMHTSKLIIQVCLVCILNVIMFSIDNNTYKRELSDISKSLPSNFYGNMPCNNMEQIFYNWRTKYKEYSENVIDLYNECKETGKYRYEVCLDIKKFFPSINPKIIYNMILKKLSIYFTDNEYNCLKVLLIKLLFFNVNNISSEKSKKEYYGDLWYNCEFVEIINKSNNKINIGIPQGLPQSYFFGNLCMVDISNIFDKEFEEGESFYYVDDSVIYTNKKLETDDLFKSSIDNLNKLINKSFENEYKDELILKDYLYSDIYYQKEFLNNKLDPELGYKIQIHDTIGKSTCSKIQGYEKYGIEILKSLSRGVSRVAFEVNSTIDEIQDSSLRKKIETLKNAVHEEISFVNSKENINDEIKSYLKILKRYKKFFLYRLKVLEYREDYNIEEQLNYFSKKYLMEKSEFNENDLEVIFENLDEDIFLTEAQMMINIYEGDKQVFISNICNFEKKLLPHLDENNLYFCKCIKDHDNDLGSFDKYFSLKSIVNTKINIFSKTDPKLQIRNIEKYLSQWNEYNNDGYSEDKSSCFLDFGLKYDKIIFVNSSEYRRRIMNSIISRIFNVEINDNFFINKTDQRIVKYYEIRLLIYIRNSNININKFILFANTVLEELKTSIEQNEKIDYSLKEVLWLFKTYVKEPEHIDQLILIHKFISGIWKNGSKYLYFYTLHNQEHSVELIKIALSICKSIDYFQLKQFDYFILFLACYLHDISMVLHPDLNKFAEDDPKSDEIYTEWKKDFDELKNKFNYDKKETKLLIKKFFEKVSCFFESNTRDNHAKDSANFIKSAYDLKFINKAIKAYVADISEAHNYNPEDVYGLKSSARTDIISEKYLIIILRLADLMDMSKDRVNLNILKQNINNMPDVSKFHWISHAAIDKCIVKSDYTFKKEEADKDLIESKKEGIENSSNNKDFKSYLSKNYLSETVIIELFLNTKNLLNVKKKGCQNINANISDNKDQITIGILKDRSNDSCNCKCNFICKWMCSKNDYLLKELVSLKTYLDRNNNNLFNTQIKLILTFKNIIPMQSKYLDIVRKEIEK